MECTEVLVGAPIIGCWHHGATVVLCTRGAEEGEEDWQVVVCSEVGEVFMVKGCAVRDVVWVNGTAFVLHGPMISMVVVAEEGKEEEQQQRATSTLVSNFERSRASLLAFSRDASCMVSSNMQPRILFSPQDETQPEFWVQAHSDLVTALLISSCGEPWPHVFTGARDGTVRKWSVSTSECSATLMTEFVGCTSFVTALQLLAEDQVLLSVCKDNSIRLWAAEGETAGKELACVSFNQEVVLIKEHQGALFVAHDTGVITCWFLLKALNGAAEGASNQMSFRGHHGVVKSMAFHDTLMLSASYDATLRVWSTETGQALRVLRGHRGPVTGCFFDAHGVAFSCAEDGMLYQWAAEGAGAAQVSPLRTEVMRPLCVASALLSRVKSWLDPFLEAAAERPTVKTDEHSQPLIETEPICPGAAEAERASREALRKGLRALVTDGDLWRVYNVRVTLGALFAAFSACITQVELAVEDHFEEQWCASLASLLTSVEKHYVPNVASLLWLTGLLQGARLSTFWERRTVSVVPHASMAQLVTLVPESLFAFLSPAARLLLSFGEREYQLLGVQALSKVCTSWAVMCHSVRDELSSGSAQRTWMGAPPDVLRSVTLNASGCLAMVRILHERGCTFADFLEDDAVHPGGFLFAPSSADATAAMESASSATLWNALLCWLAYRPEPLFPELHECWSPEEMKKRVVSLDMDAVKLLCFVCHALQAVCQGSEANMLVAGCILGPALSHPKSLTEGTLAGSCCTTMLQDATVLQHWKSSDSAELKAFFREFGLDRGKLTVSSRGVSGGGSRNGTLRVARGRENVALFGVLAYSVDMSPSAPPPKRPPPTPPNRQLPPPPATSNAHKGGTIRRRNKGAIVAAEAALAQPVPAARSSGVVSPRKNYNDTIWDDLLGLLEEGDTPSSSKFSAVLPNGADSLMANAPAQTAVANAAPSVGRQGEDMREVAESLRSFLSLEEDARTSLRSLIEEDEKDMDAPLEEDPDGADHAPFSMSWLTGDAAPCEACGAAEKGPNHVCRPLARRGSMTDSRSKTADAFARLKTSVGVDKIMAVVRERSGSVSSVSSAPLSQSPPPMAHMPDGGGHVTSPTHARKPSGGVAVFPLLNAEQQVVSPQMVRRRSGSAAQMRDLESPKSTGSQDSQPSSPTSEGRASGKRSPPLPPVPETKQPQQQPSTSTGETRGSEKRLPPLPPTPAPKMLCSSCSAPIPLGEDKQCPSCWVSLDAQKPVAKAAFAQSAPALPSLPPKRGDQARKAPVLQKASGSSGSAAPSRGSTGKQSLPALRVSHNSESAEEASAKKLPPLPAAPEQNAATSPKSRTSERVLASSSAAFVPLPRRPQLPESAAYSSPQLSRADPGSKGARPPPPKGASPAANRPPARDPPPGRPSSPPPPSKSAAEADGAPQDVGTRVITSTARPAAASNSKVPPTRGK